MYSAFYLAKKYIQYYVSASNGKGHGIHSPFVFEFIRFVKNDQTNYDFYDQIEQQRKNLLADNREIDVTDFGAGSTVIKTKKRKVSAIAASSLKAKKYSRLLHRMIQYYRCNTVLELGTSFGITTAYLAGAKNKPAVITLEGSRQIAAVAAETFSVIRLKNIETVTGNFDDTLSAVLRQHPKNDLVFFDGNHRRQPTLKYFEEVLLHSHEYSILVFDDIHWSKEMEETWEIIKQHPAITLTIDLFFIGIVFFRKECKVKQHFTLRF